MSIIGLLVALLIFCVVVWAARALMVAFNMPQQVHVVVTVIIVLIGCLWLLQAIGLLGGGPIIQLRP